jgi:hypothetical protein
MNSLTSSILGKSISVVTAFLGRATCAIQSGRGRSTIGIMKQRLFDSQQWMGVPIPRTILFASWTRSACYVTTCKDGDKACAKNASDRGIPAARLEEQRCLDLRRWSSYSIKQSPGRPDGGLSSKSNRELVFLYHRNPRFEL